MKKRIVLVCDRTGGHVYPALVLARYLRRHHDRYEVFFYGLRPADRTIVSGEGFRVCGVSLSVRNLALEAIVRLFDAVRVLISCRPSVVIGFGGRTGFLLMLLAGLLFVPSAIYEPNAVYGKANRVLGLFVRRVFLGLRHASRTKEVETGVPVRDEIITASDDPVLVRRELGLAEGRKTILVFGGSSGAHAVNMLIRDMIGRCAQGTDPLRSPTGIQFIHLTGAADKAVMEQAYADAGVPARVYEFCNDMGRLYRAADVIVCRSGASTVAEVAFARKPAILIPYPYASYHQTDNALVLRGSPWIVVLEQQGLTPEALYQGIQTLQATDVEPDAIPLRGVWVPPEEFARKIADSML